MDLSTNVNKRVMDPKSLTNHLLSKQTIGQTYHLNEPDFLKLSNYERQWLKVKE